MKNLFLICLSVVVMIGCASGPTKPNDSVIKQVLAVENASKPGSSGQQPSGKAALPTEARTLFKKLYDLNPVVAVEVGKLPGFQGQVGEKQILALSRFVAMVSRADAEAKSGLDNLLKVGKPEFRRYSTPLETLFWLLEKDEYAQENPSGLLKLSLRDLLIKGWDYNDESRWSDFSTVTDRLNAPELVNQYQRAQFKYDKDFKVWNVLQRKDEDPVDPHYIFKNKEGTCRDFAEFALSCLQKAGYESKVVLIEPAPEWPDRMKRTKHRACSFVDGGREYILDNSLSTEYRVGIIPKEDYTPSMKELKRKYKIMAKEEQGSSGKERKRNKKKEKNP